MYYRGNRPGSSPFRKDFVKEHNMVMNLNIIDYVIRKSQNYYVIAEQKEVHFIITQFADAIKHIFIIMFIFWSPDPVYFLLTWSSVYLRARVV